MKFEITRDGKTALVFGASGMVGGHVLASLLAHDAYDKVVTFGRKDLDLVHHKLEHHIIDFDQIIDYANLIVGDDLYCCLGTTIKNAGSKEAFRKVDFDYCLEIAQFAHVNKISQFLLVSAVGANAKSLFFYNQVKGELENALKKLDFWALHIFQPSLFLDYRSEVRVGEELTKMASFVLEKVLSEQLKSYRPIYTFTLARAMIMIAQKLEAGVHTYASDELRAMVDETAVAQK